MPESIYDVYLIHKCLTMAAYETLIKANKTLYKLNKISANKITEKSW